MVRSASIMPVDVWVIAPFADKTSAPVALILSISMELPSVIVTTLPTKDNFPKFAAVLSPKVTL